MRCRNRSFSNRRQEVEHGYADRLRPPRPDAGSHGERLQRLEALGLGDERRWDREVEQPRLRSRTAGEDVWLADAKIATELVGALERDELHVPPDQRPPGLFRRRADIGRTEREAQRRVG